MCDSLLDERRFRTLNIVDDFNREALAIEIDMSLSTDLITRVFDRVVARRGYPSKLRIENGPEFISNDSADWAEEHTINLGFIRCAKPTPNS